MKLTSLAAIYILFWVMSFFFVLPFGVRTSEEQGEAPLPGHAESAPHSFSFARTALRATMVATVLCGAYYLNYVYGWIGAEAFDWVH